VALDCTFVSFKSGYRTIADGGQPSGPVLQMKGGGHTASRTPEQEDGKWARPAAETEDLIRHKNADARDMDGCDGERVAKVCLFEAEYALLHGRHSRLHFICTEFKCAVRDLRLRLAYLRYAAADFVSRARPWWR
jgi:hypothetical protein